MGGYTINTLTSQIDTARISAAQIKAIVKVVQEKQQEMMKAWMNDDE